jgi:hypothetical protein
MIYTLQEGQSFDPEILRQELVAAIGSTGWHLNTAGNTVHLQMDRWFQSLLETDCEGPTTAERAVLAHFANGTIREANKAILKQIVELEAKQTPRRVREGGQWMIDLEAQIAALRGQLL